MNAKEFLEQVRYVDRAIDTKLEQLYRLRNEATKATSLVSDIPRGGSPNLQRLEDTIVKIIDLEREINRDIDRLIGEHRESVPLAGFYIVFGRSVFFGAESLVGEGIPILAC